MKEVRARVVESAKSLATCVGGMLVFFAHRCGRTLEMYLCDASNVLFAIFRREAQVLVQAEADIVAVQSVGLETLLEEVLLEGFGDRRLA